jgi:predicted RNase H-related nuclease YkuK (DUF458 family)
MDRWFITEEGKKIDIVDHCRTRIFSSDNISVYLATDSQNKGINTFYSTTVVFRYGIRGCHVVSKTEILPRIRDNFSRLFKEAEMTIEAAELISKELPIKFTALEFDYNNKLKTISTSVIQAASGWATALGYTVRVKPEEMIAAKAADHICRRSVERYKEHRPKKKKNK